MTTRSISRLLACAALAVLCGTAQAQFVTDATRLGSFAGAMRFCEDKHDPGERRYRWARLRAAKEIDDMNRLQKARALAARDAAYSRGQFLGNKLSREECRSLLKMNEWKRFFGD